MPLPPVDSVDPVIRTPEPEKGRDRVRRPGNRPEHQERGRQDGSRDSTELESDEVPPETKQDSGLAVPAEDADSDSHPQAYGPAADLRKDDQEHHIDYRA